MTYGIVPNPSIFGSLPCDNEMGKAKALNVDPMNLLADGWDLAVSISGGKDSQVTLKQLKQLHTDYQFTGQLVAVHADLGRSEWSITHRVVAKQCAELDIPLHVVRRKDSLDLVDIMNRRRLKLDGQGKPFWPSSAARYCTSDLKRAVIDVWVRNYFSSGRVLVSMGMRAEESTKRAKLPVVSLRPNCQSKSREVINWLPIHKLDLSGVWETIGYGMDDIRLIQTQIAARRAAGEDKQALIEELFQTFKAHPAYALGNSRLSCALCVLAGEDDLQNGADFNPGLYGQYTRWEMESGYAFQDGKWLSDLRPDLLEPDVKEWQRTRLVV